MRTKIKPNEIGELSKYVISKCDELDSLYNNFETIIDSISSTWIGDDSKEFITVADNDIKNEKNKNKKLRKFGEELGTVSKDYINQENAWVLDLKREINNE